MTSATAAGSSWEVPPNTGKAERRNWSAQWETSPGTTGGFAFTGVTAREEMTIFCFDLEYKYIIQAVMTGIGHGGGKKKRNNCILTNTDLLLPKNLFKSCLVWFQTGHLVGFPSSLGRSSTIQKSLWCDISPQLKTSEAKEHVYKNKRFMTAKRKGQWLSKSGLLSRKTPAEALSAVHMTEDELKNNFGGNKTGQVIKTSVKREKK